MSNGYIKVPILRSRVRTRGRSCRRTNRVTRKSKKTQAKIRIEMSSRFCCPSPSSACACLKSLEAERRRPPLSDQIWRVGLNLKWNGIYSWSPSQMKGSIINFTYIDEYKLHKPFTNKMQNANIAFSIFYNLIQLNTP